jgi:GNAT superfamily N-acetyltransferase
LELNGSSSRIRMVAVLITRRAVASDRDAVVATVVSAFVHDPAFRYFFGSDAGYQPKASAFVAYLFDKRIVHNTVWVTEECEAVSLWSPPDHSLTDDHRAWANQRQTLMKEAVGPESANRLDIYDAMVDGGLPKEPYWYLGILAADPARAGRGYGRAVMDAGLAHVRSNNGLAVLETTNARNPGYYRRAGWELLTTIQSETPSTTWILGAR